jgi:hypothetical protein
MAISDVQKGNGIGIIDPRGDIAETILNYVPKVDHYQNEPLINDLMKVF